MRDFSKYFEKRFIERDKLLDYGFKADANGYVFEILIADGVFKVVVEIYKDSKTAKVLDVCTGDEYVLVDVEESVGEYVGRAKEEYEGVLNDIVKKCSRIDIFKSAQAKDIIRYVKDKYDGDLEYLWEKFPNNAVWRNANNGKWYGVLLVIPESKLGIDSERTIEIIDLRYQKDEILKLIDNEKVFAGYHMNKSSWITIRLDGGVKTDEIIRLIDNSYLLSMKK